MADTRGERARHRIGRHANSHFAGREMHGVTQLRDAGMISVSGPGQPREASRAASGVSVPTWSAT